MDSIINAASQCNTITSWAAFTAAVVLFFCCMGGIIDTSESKDWPSKASVVCLIIFLAAGATIIGSFAVGSSALNHYKDELSSEITREYNVKMANPGEFDFKSLDEPIEVNSLDEGDTRIYECYIKKNQDGQYKLYTKSDKGAYMELSGASKAMLAE